MKGAVFENALFKGGTNPAIGSKDDCPNRLIESQGIPRARLSVRSHVYAPPFAACAVERSADHVATARLTLPASFLADR